jgi:hypothetical protein
MIILQTVGFLERVISSSQGLNLNTGQHKHRINTYTYQTSVPSVGFESTISSSEREKTVHAIEHTTVRAIAQAISRWFPPAAARVRSRVWSSGICGGQIGAGAGFLRVLRFPLPIFIPPNSPSSLSPGGRYNRPISGPRVEWIQLDSTSQ